MSDQDRDIIMADRMSARVKNASLGDFVTWLTALAICFRREVVDGQRPDAEVAKIARELVAGLDVELPEHYEGDDADERRKLHTKVQNFIGAMKPVNIADLMDEMAESYRDVLLYADVSRLTRFTRAFSGDIALASSRTVHDLVRLDREGEIGYECSAEDKELVTAGGAPTAP